MIPRVPDRCPQCGEKGTVAVETNVTGAVVQLLWWCRGCNTSWSVKRRSEAAEEPLAGRSPGRDS